MELPNVDELAFTPATELARRIREREISPVELTQRFLERIERIDPQVGSYVTVTAERALANAEAAERAVMSDDTTGLGALHGLPIAIKDLSATAGVRTTYGSRAFEQNVPQVSSPDVDRVFNAGAILLGKTNTPELGLGMTTENDIFPPTRNPWDLSRSAGGSSGGSGAALAAGLCPIAVGSDAGGSVRVPGSACGVVGLKPSRGRIIPEPFNFAAISGFATPGPMARTVDDVALLLEPMSVPLPLRPPSRPVSPDATFRIGWTVANPLATVSPDVAALVEQVANVLVDLGHEVTQSAPDIPSDFEPYMTIVRAHTAMTPVPGPALLGEAARETFEAGTRISAADYLRAEFARLDFHRRVLGWFGSFDLLLCPTLPTVAPPLGTLMGSGPEFWERLGRFGAFVTWVNMTGQPAISLPLGQSEDGLPIGVQLVGRSHAEEALLAVARRLEQAMPWADRVPEMALG